MTCDVIGVCPSCLNSKNSACVDIFVERNDAGEVTNMYVFGNDQFEDILDFSVSKDGKTITEVVCPKCKEVIPVSVPVIQSKKSKVSVAQPTQLGA
ncbi:MAG: hypothetical protein IJ310_05745 [Clostridia bacterium]|nr:hypothetical protein [Clostridia bacterium]